MNILSISSNSSSSNSSSSTISSSGSSSNSSNPTGAALSDTCDRAVIVKQPIRITKKEIVGGVCMEVAISFYVMCSIYWSNTYLPQPLNLAEVA